MAGNPQPTGGTGVLLWWMLIPGIPSHGAGALLHWVPRSQVVSGGAGNLHLLTPCLWFILIRAYKKIEEDDLKFPLIFGEGKKVKHCGRSLAERVYCLFSLFWGISAQF